MMKIIIQKIHIDWTKKSRGAPLSNLRNAIPEYYKINPEKVLKNDCLYHEIKYKEEQNFLPHETYNSIEIRNNRLEILPIKLEIKSETLKVKLFHTTSNCGLPKRKYTQQLTPLFELKKNEMGKIQYNGRISHGYWSYLKCTFRVFFIDEYHVDEINKMEPSKSFIDEALLF